MRVVWSLVLATGLLLIGLQVGESREGATAGGGDQTGDMTACSLEDGTGFPPP